MTDKDGGTRADGTMKASDFKAECLTLTPETFFGVDKGGMKIVGDIISPMPAEWFEDSDESSEELF